MAIALDYQTVYCANHARSRSLRWHAIAALLLVCSLATKIWVKLEITDLGYQLSSEKSRSMALDMERRELELQRSVLLREDRLTASAAERLRFSVPQKAQILRLGAESRG